MRGPKPYGAQRGFLRFTVARGPVPRDLPTETKTVRSPETTDGFCDILGMARETRSQARVACEGPRPTVRGHGLDSHEIKRTLRSYRP